MTDKIWVLPSPPCILASATVVGHREYEGPHGADFDFHSDDDRFGQETWEKAEAEMQRMAFSALLDKAKLREEAVGALFSGDLLNQCVGSAYGLLDFRIPYFGLYGACSTMAEGLILASLLVGNHTVSLASAVTSSHFCAAERQFRSPVEYGAQRTPTAQWTVTGAGAVLLSDTEKAGCPYVTEVLPGISGDFGVTDGSNMGAAMAPAAVDTLCRYFRLSGHKPSDFDMILTGDLGKVGYDIVIEQMEKRGYPLDSRYTDCGLLIYDRIRQDVHAGGSGCGCSAVMLAGNILKRFARGELRDVLFLGTGAMMSPSSVQQGLHIPAIAHLVRLSSYKAAKKGGRSE